MATNRSAVSPAMRLDMGAAILMAAQVNTIQSIKRRLDTFAAAHRRYVSVQSKVDAIDTQVRVAQARVAANDAAQEAAIEALARALVFGGQPRRNPFAAFGADCPFALKKLAPADAASALHRLVAAVERQRPTVAATADAAQAAEKAARAVDAALQTVDELQQLARRARQRRDAVGDTWDESLAALKRGARAAVDDGAPGLYAALFGRFTRPTRKKPQPDRNRNGAPAEQQKQQPVPIPPGPAATVTPEPAVSG